MDLRGLLVLQAFLMAVMLTGAMSQSLTVYPKQGSQIRPVGSSLMFTCMGPEGTKLKWLDTRGQEIPEDADGMYVAAVGPSHLDLIITDIQTQDAGQYTCVGEIEGNTEKISKSLLIYEPIQITAPSSQTLQKSTNALIRCVARGRPMPTRHFRFEGRPIEDGGRYLMEKDGLRIYDVTNADSGEYTCRAIVAMDGTMKEAHITVAVTGAMSQSLTAYPKQEYQERPVGGSVLFTCMGPEGTKLKWLDTRGQEIPEDADGMYVAAVGSSHLKLIITDIQTQDSGKYTCVGEIEQISKSLLIYWPIQITAPSSQTLQKSTNALIRCTARGTPIPSKYFRFQGRPIEHGGRYLMEEDGLRIYHVTYADSGEYTCRAEVVMHGMVEEAHITVTVTD